MDIVFSTPGLALDIDDTLSATTDYWVHHLQQIAPHPTLTTSEIKASYKFLEDVPFWQGREAQAWMERARSEEGMQEVLPILEEAKHALAQMRERVPVVAYITARPAIVHTATERWLAKHDFPDAPLITRPHHVSFQDSTQWKADLLHELYPNVLGIVDDNPSLVAKMPAGYQGTVFLLSQQEHERTDIRVVRCPTWQDVLERTKEIL